MPPAWLSRPGIPCRCVGEVERRLSSGGGPSAALCGRPGLSLQPRGVATGQGPRGPVQAQEPAQDTRRHLSEPRGHHLRQAQGAPCPCFCQMLCLCAARTLGDSARFPLVGGLAGMLPASSHRNCMAVCAQQHAWTLGSITQSVLRVCFETNPLYDKPPSPQCHPLLADSMLLALYTQCVILICHLCVCIPEVCCSVLDSSRLISLPLATEPSSSPQALSEGADGQ